jgi:hypothetical protein
LGLLFFGVFYILWRILAFPPSQTAGPHDYVLAGAAMLLAAKMNTLGKKLAARRAQDQLREDARPPIILLRSFQDDELLFERWHVAFLLQPEVSFEEVLAPVCANYGPVIAIGRPGEQAPPAGFGRYWVPDVAWRDKVVGLLEECYKVVVIAGETHGLAWEVSQLFALGIPEKVILVIPPNRVEQGWAQVDDLFQRWAQADDLFPALLPPFQGDEILVTFDANWMCRVWRARARHRGTYATILAAALRLSVPPGVVVRQTVGRQQCLLCQEVISGPREGTFCPSCRTPVHYRCIQVDDLPEDVVNCRQCGAVRGISRLPPSAEGM